MTPACTVTFGGRFQCRLAIDPDPYDEPRGRLGLVSTLPGEPPFDRVIRTSPEGCCIRSHCPCVGLTVLRVEPRGSAFEPAFAGAAVRLLPGTADGGPFFDSRNNLIAVQGEEPITVVHVDIVCKDGTRLGAAAAGAVPPLVGDAAQPLRDELGPYADAIAGTIDPAERRLRLDEDLRDGRIAAAVHVRRSMWLQIPRDDTRMCFVTTLAPVPAPAGRTAGSGRRLPLGEDTPWKLALMFTSWDVDAMCGVLVGRLELAMV